jgi:prepilin-type N-terminal cleavage/methylation domain-containing protein/prepilin-type processing-associated H-X9-DG protein
MNRRAFTLIELLAVVAIISLLITLVFPATQTLLLRANSVRCGNNLRQIGIAVLLYATDHDHRLPEIETDPTNPVYPADQNVKGMGETLGPYGAVAGVLQCPADLKAQNCYATKGTSYEWRPSIDGEIASNPTLYGRFGQFPVSPSRVRIAMDFWQVHSGHTNRLYADGHVVTF